MSKTKFHVKAETIMGGDTSKPLITALEANVDPDLVTISISEYAIRELYPLRFVIEGTTVFLFTEYILKPMLNPIAERWNWKTIVEKHRNPHQPFTIIAHLTEDNISLELDYEMNQEHIERIWKYLQSAIEVMQKFNLIGELTKVRLVSNSPSEMQVIGYQNAKPTYIIDIDGGQILPIAGGSIEKYREPSFEETQLIRSQKYRDSLDASSHKSNTEMN